MRKPPFSPNSQAQRSVSYCKNKTIFKYVLAVRKD